MQFKSLFESIFKKSSSKKMSFRFMKDIPEHLEDNRIYIIGEKKYYWSIIFYCPCGCGEIISLNLLKEARPRWRFSIRWGKISLTPSIWRTVGCKSHFNVKWSKVKWCFYD